MNKYQQKNTKNKGAGEKCQSEIIVAPLRIRESLIFKQNSAGHVHYKHDPHYAQKL
jgi:hypothetical protein